MKPFETVIKTNFTTRILIHGSCTDKSKNRKNQYPEKVLVESKYKLKEQTVKRFIIEDLTDSHSDFGYDF